MTDSRQNNLTLFKPPHNVDRPISEFKGRNLVIGCGKCTQCSGKHPATEFYSIDKDYTIAPDACLDITQAISPDLLPDGRFDFIYFENIDFTCFMDFQNQIKPDTFNNIYRLLSDDGICAIATAPLARLPLGKYRSTKYYDNLFSSTILCEYASSTEEFKAGRIYKTLPSGNFDGGLLILRKSAIDESITISKLNPSAQCILKSEFIAKEQEAYAEQNRMVTNFHLRMV